MNHAKILLMMGVSVMALSSTAAFAQVVTDISPDPIEGVSITSNEDNSSGEYFVIYESDRDSNAATTGDRIEVFYADGDVVTRVNNDNNLILNYDNDDNGGGTFALRSGGSNVLTANNAGNVTIANSMTTNGIDNGNDGITNAGAISGVTTLTTSGLATLNSASITNNATVGGTFGVTGATTLDGATTVNNTLSVDSNGGTAGGTTLTVNNTAATTTSGNGNSSTVVNNSGVTMAHQTNSVVVGATQTGTIGANSFDYGTTVTGGMYIDGDLGVDGRIYALDPSASSGINVGNNGLDVEGSSNTTTLTADSNGTANDGRGQITLQEDNASFYVYNSTTGNAHGLAVNQTQTVLSGGTTSTSLTLNDEGATFRDDSTGGPARVMGVADGRDDFDAVNYRQYKKLERQASGGIASVAAMANIPAPSQDQRFALGLGVGSFEGEQAGAFGGSARLSENWTLKGSFGRSHDNNTFGAGVSFGW